MTGLVQVGGSVGTGGRVPLDDIGLPMLVGKLTPTGGTLRIEWDASGSLASDHALLWGHGLRGGAYFPDGSVCSATAPFVWTDTPDPATDPSRLVWWLIVPTGDAAESQSSLSDICP